MIDLRGIGETLTGVAALYGAVMSTRASRRAGEAKDVAVEARDIAKVVADNLDKHYNRVEATYEASREATLSLLAYLQGRTNGRNGV